MGINTLPNQLSTELSEDPAFMTALYHVLMHVHLVKGVLICPVTGHEIFVEDGIPDFSLLEENCENSRY
jgi:uncharacterized protein YbaR (Trm112 family)